MEEYEYVDVDTGKKISPEEIQGSKNGATNMYIPSGKVDKGERADLIDKISPEKMIPIMKNYLMGYEWDELNKKWVLNPSLKDYSLNELGASRIATLMLGASTKNVSLSSLKPEEIKARLLSIVKTAQYMALENWMEFGIRRTSQFYFINDIVFTNTLAVLKQADGEGIKKLIAGTVQEHRNVAVQEEQQKKRLWGLFKK